MRIACPKCNNIDVDCVYELFQDPTDSLYMIISKCNICNHIGQNVTFWFYNDSAEIIRNTTEVNKTEKEIWEKKNI